MGCDEAFCLQVNRTDGLLLLSVSSSLRFYSQHYPFQILSSTRNQLLLHFLTFFFPCFLFFNQTLPHWRLVIILIFCYQEQLLHVLVTYLWNIVSKLRFAPNLLVIHSLYSGPTCKENLTFFAFLLSEFVSWLKTLDWRFCILELIAY